MLLCYVPINTENYTTLCTLEVDISKLPMTLQRKISGEGTFYRIDYDIVLLFGLTELQAMVAWKENVGPVFALFASILFTECGWQGVERRSPAKIIYEPDLTDDNSLLKDPKKKGKFWWN